MYDSIKAWTCKLGRIEKLYAFNYQPQSPEKEVNGWQIYDPRREWKRLGISDNGVDKGWRISKINTDYGVGLCSLWGQVEMFIACLVLANVSCLTACALGDI